MEMHDSIKKLFERDVERLIAEIELYPTNESLWIKPDGINNSAGTLALHLIGNLNHFIGAVMGDTGYIRDREAEFGDRGIPKTEILTSLEDTKVMLSNTLTKVTTPQLEEKYPIEVFGKPMSTGEFLVHLLGHLNYHLGQINYHRRLLT